MDLNFEGGRWDVSDSLILTLNLAVVVNYSLLNLVGCYTIKFQTDSGVGM